jgi:hypothetical protein
MTPELIQSWIASGADELAEHRKSPAVQQPADMQRDLVPRLGRLHQVADKLYDRWTASL